jgi:hypothetical protein
LHGSLKYAMNSSCFLIHTLFFFLTMFYVPNKLFFLALTEFQRRLCFESNIKSDILLKCRKKMVFGDLLLSVEKSDGDFL